MAGGTGEVIPQELLEGKGDLLWPQDLQNKTAAAIIKGETSKSVDGHQPVANSQSVLESGKL